MKNEVTKTKRIKRVFGSGNQVLHLWANQSQSDARSRNVFFEGTRCYSYGRHYLLGQLVQFRGATVAVINATGYSATTAKHISWAWSAVENMPRVKVEGSMDIMAGLLKTQGELVEKLMGQFSRRTFWSGERKVLTNDSWLMTEIADFNRTVRACRLEHLAIDVTEDFSALVDEHAKQALARAAALNSPEAVAARAAKAQKRAEGAVKAWRAGGSLTDQVRNLRPHLLRVYGDVVQTSGGASVPLVAAQALLKRVQSGKAEAGEAIGNFKVSDVNVQGNEGLVRIGCHTIALSEAVAVLQPATQPEAA